MAKKDNKEIDLEILLPVSELNDYIEEVERKINDLRMHVNSAKSDDKVKASRIRIGSLKKTQEDMKQRFNDFIMENCQHESQENLKMNKSFEDVKAGIKEFKKEEDNVNERLNELMMIQFDKSDDLDKDSGVCTVIKGQEQYMYDAASRGEKCCGFLRAKKEKLGIQGIKIQEDHFKNEEAPAFDRCGQSSVVDIEKITDSASSDDLGGGSNFEVMEQKICQLILERKELLNTDEEDLTEFVKELFNMDQRV